MITLIANSGIQTYTKKLTLNLSEKVIPAQYFWQRKDDFSEENDKYKLDLAYQLEDGSLVPKILLEFDNEGNLTTTNFDIIPQIQDEELIQVTKIRNCIEQYKSFWFPIPFFKLNIQNNQNVFGPTGWARMLLNEVRYFEDELGESFVSFNVNIAFDTSLSSGIDLNVALDEDDTTELNNCFALSRDSNLNLNFLSSEEKCEWIDDYLLSIIHKGELPNNDQPLKYIANYLYLIQFLANLKGENEIEKILLYPNNMMEAVDVDLILDIGNARTCGLLFESIPNKSTYNFTSVRKLELANLSKPGTIYTQPFSMRLAFFKAKFGDVEVPQYPNHFAWPSVLRLGKEAEQILNNFDIPSQILTEPANTLSSPKRYLWDTKISEKPWEFVSHSNDLFGHYKRQHVLISHLNSQFTREGKLVESKKPTDAKEIDTTEFDAGMGVEPKWSRNSLMTFVMIEIINHAVKQINSHGFRKENDAFLAKCRKLRRIVITCPTGMTEAEQVHLRNSAKYAVEALKKYHEEIRSSNNSDSGEIDLSGFNISDEDVDMSIISQENSISDSPFANIEVVPDRKCNSKLQSKAELKEDWIYDESSASQINFIYAEVVKKYKENFKKFFDVYGKKSSQNSERPDSLTIASVDIGGGTTDLMICNYTYEKEQHSPHLTPNPLYWETFNLAGDDLLKEIINQVLIDGKGQSSNRYEGVIRFYCNEIGCQNVTDKILHFFGERAAYMGASHNFYRKSFINQVLIPIAYRFLENVSADGTTNAELSYEDIFTDTQPNEQLIEYVNNHFGGEFNFREIKWYVSRDKLNEIINIKYKKIFKQIASLVYACKADFLLLAGKLSELKEIRNMFVQELPLTPDRIISLSNYQIGTWYPFTNKKGYINDAKTTVAVGAMLYALGGKYNSLNGLRLNTSKLKEKLISTANYIGSYNAIRGSLNNIYLGPKTENFTIKGLTPPLILGFKQLPSKSYPARPIYILDFKENNISDRIKKKNPTYSDLQLRNATIEQLKRLKNSKYNIEISREIENSKEKLKITGIEDLISVRPVVAADFELKLMTAEQPNGYWLDTGEFITLSHED